jgi:ribosomal protein S18 acetylase RimI-like enzyme
MEYKNGVIPDRNQIYNLYSDAGWIKYLENIDGLVRGYNKSNYIETVWNNEELIGVIRCIGDGETISYIQDIIVKKNFQRNGIGRKLIKNYLENNKHIRQIVLLTDDREEVKAFYKSCKFKLVEDFNLKSFIFLGNN